MRFEMLKVTNTLSGEKETFQPLQAPQVRMYVCGPTVYGDIHIGNARSQVNFDVIRKYLIYAGYQVTYVVNITDIDDKIINFPSTKNGKPRKWPRPIRRLSSR
jgi:cysteinyl-tRNA synthetase